MTRQGRVLVTGGAGFIGSHVVDHLLAEGSEVVCVDDLSAGTTDNLRAAMEHDRFSFVEADVLDIATMEEAMAGCDTAIHAAADPEVRKAPERIQQHLNQNITATHHVLEAMRGAGVKRMCFMSTSTVYGDAQTIPTPESYGPLEPISVYGAAKLASESIISSYCHTFDMTAVIFRFANVVGPRSNHGVTFDFVRKLRENPKEMEILGDGKQNKSYVHVEDTVRGMLYGEAASRGTLFQIYNIGSRDQIDVNTIADIVAHELGLSDVKYTHTGGVDGGRGWKGDVKIMRLAIDKLETTGWSPKHSSADAIRLTARSLVNGG